MPNTRSGSQSKKGAGSSAAKNPAPAKSTGSKKAGTKKTAATTRFAERQARKEEEARLARQERNKRYAFISIALVVVLIAVLVVVKVASGGSGGGSAAGGDIPSPVRGEAIAPATLAHLQSVPLATLNSAPTDGIIKAPQATNGKALTANGKPELLYIGAEYCPYCAGERWPMYVALSKFGTFNPEPGKIHSATQDGNIPTLTYYGTQYSSPYLTFTPVEVYTNYLNSAGTNYAQLQLPSQAQLNLWQAGNQGSFPYLNFGGKAILPAAQFDSAPMGNMAFSAVAAQVGDNSTPIGAPINAAAAQLIKTICSTMTHDQPAAVCSP